MLERPIVHCLAAECFPDGRTRGNPIVVSLETAEWLMRVHHWIIVGPDLEDLQALADFDRLQNELRRLT